MRMKVRLRAIEKARMFDAAKRAADVDVVPKFKDFIRGLSFIDRVKIAFNILRGKF